MKSIKLRANLAEGQHFTAQHAGPKTKFRAAAQQEGQEGVAEGVEEISEGWCRGRVGVQDPSPHFHFPSLGLPKLIWDPARMGLLSVIYTVGELETRLQGPRSLSVWR